MSFLVIHGHFYQPPRENPWSEQIEPEPSAAPWGNWNERIHDECYRPNGLARIVDTSGLLSRLVNNYEHLSFNFGPTLLGWLRLHHADTYRRIQEADRTSLKRRQGHGNAIAQGYNHAILPLCSPRDLRTQIRWGIEDFRFHFGREPEALWLPETACGEPTLEALIEARMRYAILSPMQAKRVRRLGTEQFSDVSAGRIDPSRAYRFFHRDGSGRSIELLFYHGAVAQGIAFEGALSTSEALTTRLRGARFGPLVHVATDGESYGHHSKFGERSLAYALEVLAPKDGFRLSNYGEFLDHHPAEYEAQLAPGEEGLGTSWSCAHGVGRWMRDCGCHTGGQPGWNQAWRAPLLAALHFVRDSAARSFESRGAPLFKDVWAARDAYIKVVLDRSKAVVDTFFAEHAQKELSPTDRTSALTLLELQRNALLMYTSCGWFFNDLSGIETIQVLKYAAYSLELMKAAGDRSPKDEFLDRLALAKSNQKDGATGADLFKKEVEICAITPGRVAAHVAISGLLEDQPKQADSEAHRAGGYRYEVMDRERFEAGTLSLAIGHLRLTELSSERRADQAYAALHFGGTDFYCAARPHPGDSAYHAAKERLAEAFHSAPLPRMLRLARKEFGPTEFGLDHVLPAERKGIAASVYAHLVNRFCDEYAYLYEDSRRTLEMLQRAGFELPAELRSAVEFTLGRRFEREIAEAHAGGDRAAYRRALETAEEVAAGGYKIVRPQSVEIFRELILDKIRTALEVQTAPAFEEVESLLELCRRLGVQAGLYEAQEIVLGAAHGGHRSAELRRLASVLYLSPQIFEP